MKFSILITSIALNICAILAGDHMHHINDVNDISISANSKGKGDVKIDSPEAESYYNSENGPCNAAFWNKKLKGAVFNGKEFEKNGESLGKILREYVKGDCEILTKIFDEDRLVFNYYDQEKCTKFKSAACN
ncbi:hypothetical protein CONCODRAFT_11526 [Conidiobolus coronatus NRRL 28638]|uniref:Uncharacterized protein n=1 Tax=Conidiobolus coronatus (strain ATCC 28846 / CBS 209.66 / NRRL 28638) TaxID=796925 RepID=A0A137NUU8_CONC2|nr:hypothetical protein CONCODRAFT_11526 [Conidiobolus coronatus NRRL 28638]|eukprot:KXN66583.1 hypothetical protein CONCODRAFT_11526 [Conidiobolus coronatus NRRL 28638]